MIRLLPEKEELFLAQEYVRHGIVRVNVQDPFTFRGKTRSPVKLDFDAAQGSRELVRRIILEFSQKLPPIVRSAYGCGPKETAFVGVPSGGVFWAECLAAQFDALFCPSRKVPNAELGFETTFAPRRPSIIVEDVITKAGSAGALCELLQESKCVVRVCVSLFTHGFLAAERRFETAHVIHATLGTWGSLRIAMAESFGADVMGEVDVWRDDPYKWTRLRGFT